MAFVSRPSARVAPREPAWRRARQIWSVDGKSRPRRRLVRPAFRIRIRNPRRGWSSLWAMRALIVIALTAGVATMAAGVRAFPGMLVAKDGATHSVRSTSIVLMQHGGYSIVTLMAEVEGPLQPFALLVPVPADVTPSRLRTVRRSILARVESVSAPRLHAFYEQDPCDDGPVEQAWD